MLPEVRMARITDAIELHRKKKLSCVEAGALLGMSERHFRRLRDAYEERGAEGIIDRRRGRLSGRRAGVGEIEWVIEEFRPRYFDFTAKHFHEAIHGRPMADSKLFVRSYTWTKSVLQLPEQRHRRHFVRAPSGSYPDGRLAVFHGPRRLADYEPEGALIDQISPARTA